MTIVANRGSEAGAHVGTYAIPGQISSSASTLVVRFFAGADGAGQEVAMATAQFSSAQPHLSLSQIVLEGKVASVAAASETMTTGQTRQLTFTARDHEGHTIAMSPGSATWTQLSGTGIFSVTADGVVTATGVGSGEVRATVDGVVSPAATVTVQPAVTRVFRFAKPRIRSSSKVASSTELAT